VLHARQHHSRAAAPARRGGVRLPPGRGEPAARPAGVRHRQRRPDRRTGAGGGGRDARTRSQDRHRVQLIDPGRPRQPLRRQQARGRGRPAGLRGAHRRGGARLPPAQRVRQVVPAELQLGGGHLLPQHRARAADPDQRPGRAGDAGVCGRRGRALHPAHGRRRRRGGCRAALPP
jgi:hypothetical protein